MVWPVDVYENFEESYHSRIEKQGVGVLIASISSKDSECSFISYPLSLGTRMHIPSGHMVNTLWGQTTLDHNVPSD